MFWVAKMIVKTQIKTLTSKEIKREEKEGCFKLVDKGMAEMAVDGDPFPKLDINMVSYEEPI